MLTVEDASTALDLLQTFTEEYSRREPSVGISGLTDDDVVALAHMAEHAGRCTDALRIAIAAEIDERSRSTLDASERLSSTFGCRSAVELLERLTLVSPKTVASRIRLGKQVRARFGVDGAEFPPRFPAVAAGLASGALGLDSAEVIVGVLGPLLGRVDVDQVQFAEEALVSAATGVPIDAREEPTVPESAGLIDVQAQAWRAVIDPDGIEPNENRAMQNRAFRLGRVRDGLVTVSGGLMPEVAGKVQRLMDAYMSPRTMPVAFLTPEESDLQADRASLERDDRTRDQLGHDLLAMVIDSAARSADAPKLGGASPAVMVSVREEDLRAGTGAGHIDGQVVPISMLAVEQMICAGGMQPVTVSTQGKIIELGVTDRCFTGAQRRAITLRDGGCIIPGCQSPAAWAEIHHVIQIGRAHV